MEQFNLELPQNKREREEGKKFYSAQQFIQEMRDNKRKKKRLVQND